MAIVDELSPIKKRFFQELGILKDEDIPESFLDVIASYSEEFSESEKFCISDHNIAFRSKSLFSLADVIGTNHQRYANKTWLEAFLDLDRGDETLELYYSNPNYYGEIKSDSDLGLAFKDGKYYILDCAGGGNNRLIIMKIKYLAMANKRNENITSLNDEFSFMGNIRVSPSEEVAKTIFYLMFPNGGFVPSGYQVLNKSKRVDEPLFDVVKDYPFNTQVVKENIDENTLKDLYYSSDEDIKKR